MNRFVPGSPVRTGRRALVVGAGLLLVACTAQGPTASSPSATPVPDVATPSAASSPSASTVPTASASASAAVVDRVPAAYVEGVEYRPAIDPADFSAVVDNPYLPWTPGSIWRYEGGGEQIEVTVTGSTRSVMGIPTVVVRDRVHEDGRLTEDTEDWYAQDRAGNVWYFGEATAECEDGAITDRHGSWEAGVDGAQPGIVMLAEPQVGDRYRQEFLAGEAEDQAKVVQLDGHVEGPTGTYDDVIVTEDFTPLEPDLLEDKAYARGVGVVEERTIKGGSGVVRLVEFVPGDGSAPAAPAYDPCHE